MIVSGGKKLGFAPQALAEVVPLADSTGYFYAQGGTSLVDHYASYSALYRAQPSLATVVDKISTAAARLTFKTWRVNGSDLEADTSSAWAKLWQNPSPVLAPFAFWRWTFSTYELYGEVFWMKMRVAGPGSAVIALYPMHPSRVAVRRKPDGTVEYIFSLGVASAGLLTLSEQDVVAFKRYNPDDIMRGLSRVEPLRSTLADEDAARRATSSSWRRGARPGLMLSTDGKLSDGALGRLKQQVDASHSGPDNAGSSLILEEGLKPQLTQLTAVEMEYIESRKLNLQEVCMVYDVPPPVIHILDHATFSNITEQMRSMYRDTMAPRLEDVESAISHQLLPDFDVSGGLCGRFALDEVLRGDFETRATAVRTLISTGVMTPNEARTLFDLPKFVSPDEEDHDEFETADKLFANAALQPLGSPQERVSITEAGQADPAQQELLDDTQSAAQADDKPVADEAPPPQASGKQNRRRTVRRHARAAERQEAE